MIQKQSWFFNKLFAAEGRSYIKSLFNNKAGRDMRNKGNFSQKIFLRDMEISFNICEGHENNTLCRPLSGIFLFVHRSLWNPITPSKQAEICSNSDRPIGNIYY